MARRKRIELRPDLEHQWHYQLNPDGTKTLQFRPDLCLSVAVDMINDMFEDAEERCEQRAEPSPHPGAHEQAECDSLSDGHEQPDIVRPRAPQLRWADA